MDSVDGSTLMESKYGRIALPHSQSMVVRSELHLMHDADDAYRPLHGDQIFRATSSANAPSPSRRHYDRCN